MADIMPPVPRHGDPNLAKPGDGAFALDLAARAMERLHRDLDRYKPDRPSLTYALMGETHDAITHEWRLQHPDALVTLLTALQEAALGVASRLQAEIALIAPANCYMYGPQDDAIRLETQMDILHEELLRIEAELCQLGYAPQLQ